MTLEHNSYIMFPRFNLLIFCAYEINEAAFDLKLNHFFFFWPHQLFLRLLLILFSEQTYKH